MMQQGNDKQFIGDKVGDIILPIGSYNEYQQESPLFGILRVYLLPNGQIYFNGTDATTGLGYDNTTNPLLEIWDEYKIKVQTKVPNTGYVTVSTSLTENGLYQLIMRSNKEKAKPFQRWVYEEVLPSLRKHGVYIDQRDFINRTLGIREEGKTIRNNMTEYWNKNGINKIMPISHFTNQVYEGMYGLDAASMKTNIGMPGENNPNHILRDYLPDCELEKLSKLEDYIATLVRFDMVSKEMLDAAVKYYADRSNYKPQDTIIIKDPKTGKEIVVKSPISRAPYDYNKIDNDENHRYHRPSYEDYLRSLEENKKDDDDDGVRSR